MASLRERWNKLSFVGKSIVGLTAAAAVAAITILSLGAAGVIAGGAVGAFETVGTAIANNYIPVVAGAGGLAVGLGAGAIASYNQRKGRSGRSGVSPELAQSNELALAPKLARGQAPEQYRENNFAEKAAANREEQLASGYSR